MEDPAVAWILAGAGCAVIAAMGLRSLRRHPAAPAAFLRKHAPAFICLGLVIAAGGVFLRYTVDEYSPPPAFLLRQGYVAFFGALVAVTGLYSWLMRPKNG